MPPTLANGKIFDTTGEVSGTWVRGRTTSPAP